MTTWILYVFFWVINRRLNFICRRFGTLCLFHLHRQVGVLYTYLPMKKGQSVPKRRHIKFRWRGITQKKTYNIQNTAKVWNQEYLNTIPFFHDNITYFQSNSVYRDLKFSSLNITFNSLNYDVCVCVCWLNFCIIGPYVPPLQFSFPWGNCNLSLDICLHPC
jgi:hypothetical protein